MGRKKLIYGSYFMVRSEHARSGKVSPEILLLLAIVLCASFEVVAYIKSGKDLDGVHDEIKQSETRGNQRIETIADELNKRYLQLLKLAEDLALQQGRLVTMERTLSSEKDSLAQLQDTVNSQLEAIKKAGGEQSKEVAALQDKFNADIASKEKTITQLQGEYEMLKHLMDDQSALLVMMREQSILNSTNSPSAAGNQIAPVDVAKTAGAGSQAPQSFQSGAIVPIPSSEAVPSGMASVPAGPQPVTQPPAPVQIHDAEKVSPTNAPASAKPGPGAPSSH